MTALQETNHTPGPWTASRNIAYWDISSAGKDRHGDIASVCPSKFAHPKNEAANAQLIAAAPDLLAALQMTDLDLHASDERGECRCSQCNFRRAAKAAIQKATTL